MYSQAGSAGLKCLVAAAYHSVNTGKHAVFQRKKVQVQGSLFVSPKTRKIFTCPASNPFSGMCEIVGRCLTSVGVCRHGKRKLNRPNQPTHHQTHPFFLGKNAHSPIEQNGSLNSKPSNSGGCRRRFQDSKKLVPN